MVPYPAGSVTACRFNLGQRSEHYPRRGKRWGTGPFAQSRSRRPLPVPHRRHRVRGPTRRLAWSCPHQGRTWPPASRRHAASSPRARSAFCATNSGSSAAPPRPDELASVERGVCTSEFALMAGLLTAVRHMVHDAADYRDAPSSPWQACRCR